ncbi:MAG: hypothetical protein A2201_08345 [Alicyclobacillus sp. RIFOXYA1_FULL_53_8]|nr:MAG: hypothetical protein A2201_08345 [Alicyclobacillus sp. RIFOXYA1_FULL_53_8]
MLTLHSVAKEYDLRPVLDDVNLALERGLRYSLSAENGSGKTTLLQIMAGLSKPTRGKVLWMGQPMSAKQRGLVGVVLQSSFLFGDLTAHENLSLYATLYGRPGPHRLATEWLQRIGLEYAGNAFVREFSKGMKQRLALARAMIHQPQVLLLDEPFDGLDVQSTKLFQDLLQQSQEAGTAVFLVTHQPTEASAAHRRFTLKYGRLVDLP